jgi:hypothetical protein
VTHALSVGFIPDALQTPARKRVKDKTGTSWVPTLETDAGEWISGSKEIAAWAERNPAGAATSPAA